jgi:glycosyltransferase involved in cell wall biosynthesis
MEKIMDSIQSRYAYRHTIAICTSRRIKQVCLTIEQLPCAIAYPSETEVVIINNGPDEDTSILHSSLRSTLQSLGVANSVYEEQVPGLSSARNRALREARGGIITFIDDDASPESPEWQETILAAFERFPQIGIVGGPAALVAPDQRAPWWRSEVTDGLFSCSKGPGRGFCEPESLVGVNISYRMSAVGNRLFDQRLGWNAQVKLPFAGEETLFNRELAEAGWSSWFETRALVLHRIESERFNASWLIRRAYIAGKTSAFLSGRFGRTYEVVRKEALRGIGAALPKLMVRFIQGKFDRVFANMLLLIRNLGMLSHHRRTEVDRVGG